MILLIIITYVVGLFVTIFILNLLYKLNLIDNLFHVKDPPYKGRGDETDAIIAPGCVVCVFWPIILILLILAIPVLLLFSSSEYISNYIIKTYHKDDYNESL